MRSPTMVRNCSTVMSIVTDVSADQRARMRISAHGIAVGNVTSSPNARSTGPSARRAARARSKS